MEIYGRVISIRGRSMDRFLMGSVFACLMVLVSASAISQPLRVPSETPTGPSIGELSTPPSSFTEVTLLKAQLEDQRNFQDQILSTVHWSLGTLGSLAVLLIGFGWFANFRMYERDKSALQTELHAQLLEEVRKASDSAAQAAASTFSKQDAELNEKLAAFNGQLSAMTKTYIDSAEKRAAAEVARITSRLDGLKSDVLKLELAAQLRKRQSWISQKIPRNALQASVNALKLANEVAYEHDIAEVLDLVAQDMTAIVEQKAKPIDNFLAGQLVATLDSVKGTHAHAAAGLKARAMDLLSA